MNEITTNAADIMTPEEIAQAAATIREYTRIKEEAESIITAQQDAIKAHFKATQTEDASGADYKITWHMVNSSKLDQAALKKDHPDIAAAYTQANPYRRFLLK